MIRTHKHPSHELHLLTNPSVWLCAVAAAFTMGTAHAQQTADDLQVPSNVDSMSPKQAYQHDVQYCNSMRALEPRKLCLKEASRAYQEARAGKLQPQGTSTASSDRDSYGATSTSGTEAAADAASGSAKAKHRAAKRHPRHAKGTAGAASASDMGGTPGNMGSGNSGSANTGSGTSK